MSRRTPSAPRPGRLTLTRLALRCHTCHAAAASLVATTANTTAAVATTSVTTTTEPSSTAALTAAALTAAALTAAALTAAAAAAQRGAAPPLRRWRRRDVPWSPPLIEQGVPSGGAAARER